MIQQVLFRDNLGIHFRRFLFGYCRRGWWRHDGTVGRQGRQELIGKHTRVGIRHVHHFCVKQRLQEGMIQGRVSKQILFATTGFGSRHDVVDGNIKRVLQQYCRSSLLLYLFGLHSDTAAGATRSCGVSSCLVPHLFGCVVVCDG